MKIINLRMRQIGAISTIAGLMLSLVTLVSTAQAAVAMGPADPIIRESNSDSTVVQSYSPELGPTLTVGSTSEKAYYGVVANSDASSSDVYWRITVSHATSSLLIGDVSITEKGWYDNSGHQVADSPYTPLMMGDDLVLTGDSGWSVEAGENFTDVDEITFSPSAPKGDYTITRELIDNSSASSTSMTGTHVINVTILAATSSSTGTSTATSTASTTDNTAPVFGTTTDVYATTSGSTTTVDFNVTATDDSGTTTVSCMPTSGSTFSLGTTTVNCTAEDSSNNTATTSFSVIVTQASSTATSTGSTTPPDNNQNNNGGGGGGGGGSSRPVGGIDSSTNVNVGSVNGNTGGIGIVVAGTVVGNAGTPIVLGATTYRFTLALNVGSRGEEVRQLQMRLTALGFYSGPITGYFGELTRAGVMRFQAAMGISQTGNVGPLTRAALNS